MIRKNTLINDQVYHIISRSIAGYKIFNNPREYSRFVNMLSFYQRDIPYKYSAFDELSPQRKLEIINNAKQNHSNYRVIIIAYCIMPSHIHLLLKQVNDNGISNFIRNILNSYSRYFNIKHERKGPLWESRFKNIIVESDEQLLHLTRYIHLNASSAGIVNKPKEWAFSSYREYINPKNAQVCDFTDLIDLTPRDYSKFVNNRIGYQRELSKIKKILLENHID